MARGKKKDVEYVLTDEDLRKVSKMLGRRGGSDLLELPPDRQTQIVATYIASRNGSGWSPRVSVVPVGAGKRK